MFERGSRYEQVPDGVFVDAAGRERPYKLLRLVPDAPAQVGHLVVEGERLDLIAHRYYGDPERFWRLCDANRALRPVELEETGRRLHVPLALP